MGCANSVAVIDKRAAAPKTVGRVGHEAASKRSSAGEAHSTPVKASLNTAGRASHEAALKRSGDHEAHPTPFKEGSVSDLTFIGKLGQGACATVRRARAATLGDKEVTVKVVDLMSTDMEDRDAKQLSESRLRHAREEVAILTQLAGQANVIEFYGSFTDRSLSFIVMEKCERPLQNAIERMHSITEATMSHVLLEMLRGLASVHEAGIVHRDVKPEHFLCVGPEDTVKLSDFRVAFALPGSGNGLTGLYGTAPFMSPEMLIDKPYDQKSDAWSFGVIVYSLFYGLFPYGPLEKTSKGIRAMIRSGLPTPSFRPTQAIESAEMVSDGARQLVFDLLNRNPEARISATDACRHRFFAKPGKTDLTPTFESSKKLGAFRGSTGKGPSRRSEVDLRIESMQREQEEVRDSLELQVSDIKIDVFAKHASDEQCSTRDTSECYYSSARSSAS